LVLGGLKHGKQTFDAKRAATNAAMLMLALVGLYLPAAFTLSVRDTGVIEEVSLLVAIVLIVTYVLYLVYTVFWRAKSDTAPSKEAEIPQTKKKQAEKEGGWSVTKSIVVLALTIVGTGVVSELLVNTVEATVK